MSRYPKIDNRVQQSLKRMGKVDLWRRYVGGSFETAETIGNYRVEKSIPSEGVLHLILWNPSTPCVSIYIYGDEAILSSLEYSPKCTIDGRMKRGEGTREMIQFALDLAKQHGAKTIQLQDESTITCATGERVKLGPFYFFKYGKTWYEKQFGFSPTPEFRDEYARAKELRKKMDTLTLECSYFTRENTFKLLSKVELDFFSFVWEKTL